MSKKELTVSQAVVPNHERSEIPQLLSAPPITAAELIEFPFTRDDPLNRMALAPIYTYAYPVDDAVEFAAFIRSPLDGMGINHLLLSTAKYKKFGLDTEDILSDWKIIDRDTENMRARRERHEGMGEAWRVFMRDKDFLYERIQNAQNKKNKEKRKRVIPVARWRSSGSGQREWILDSFCYDKNPSPQVAEIVKLNTPQSPLFDPRGLNSLIGVYAVAHFSPDIKDQWPERDGYGGDPQVIQSMGPTQASVQAIRYAYTLLNSPFLVNAEEYIVKHGIPISF